MNKLQALKSGASYLLGKVPAGKISASTLGWIRPDKTIRFSTTDAAYNYAKNTVVKALNSPNPYEKSVVVNGKTILSEVNGSKNKCLVPLGSKGTWIHGHPDFCGKRKAFPFSALDYQTFMGNDKLTGAIIYNSAGEASAMRKKSPKGLLGKLVTKLIPDEKYQQIKTQSRIGYASSGYNSKLLANTDKKTKIKLDKLTIQKQIANAKGDIKKATQLVKEWSELYNKEVEKATHSESIAISIHKFWADNASRLGIEYASNFSNFVKK